MQITKFKITNFRSLVDFQIEKFSSTTFFYGLNNAGKSNILNALNIIFARKVQYDSEGFTPRKNFYEGLLRNFSNSFYQKNDSLSISFTIELKTLKTELTIPAQIEPLFPTWPDEIILSVEGNIVKNTQEYEPGLAEIKTRLMKVNGVVIYDPSNTTGFYFPSLISTNRANVGELGTAFTSFIDILNDCVYVVSSTRDMHPTAYNYSGEPIDITPKNFKRFLHRLYLSENDHSVFENINEAFSSEPFSFGSISFSELNDELEVMIKEYAIRLPIKDLGSGVLQILYIISIIVYKKSKIICLEELEQNLSPELQIHALRKLQSMIGEYLDQLIISSHSSVFVKSKLSDAIHLIEKADGKTVWAEEITEAMGRKAKKHFQPAALPPGNYNSRSHRKFQQEW